LKIRAALRSVSVTRTHGFYSARHTGPPKTGLFRWGRRRPEIEGHRAAARKSLLRAVTHVRTVPNGVPRKDARHIWWVHLPVVSYWLSVPGCCPPTTKSWAAAAGRSLLIVSAVQSKRHNGRMAERLFTGSGRHNIFTQIGLFPSCLVGLACKNANS